VVIEIYVLVLEERGALARFGRRLVGYVLAAALAIASIPPFLASQVPASFRLRAITFQVEEVVEGVELLFLAAMVLFLLWFPIRIRKNLAVYITGFAVYFGARWMLLFLALQSSDRALRTVFNIA